METINNMAASAARAVWGENQPSTEEPVSGRTGDTSKGEPYDAGNMEPISSDTGNVASSNGTAKGNVDKEPAEDAKFAKTTGTAVESEDTPDNPSSNLKAQSGPDDTSKGQGDTRPPEDPKTNPKSAPTDVNDAPEEGVNEAQKLEGPGPKPLAEVARENGGDAGNDSTSSVDKPKSNEKEDKETEEDAHKSGGTGEQYVKSSGLQADGGDFDATNPGAGKEADRLMEQKGMHTAADSDGAGDGGSSPRSKKSFGQKIKDKLHRH
ncbi:hypothetical protein F5Y09DRAFT_293934 [Xylaria sp. FL1042]|nr:hypothetical protein F5Y09DRAFT_293934 [Xylaria sp. FL1042]